MTLSALNVLVLLGGLFLVPVVLLWRGHRLRRQSPRFRGAFWGAVIGHCIAATIALIAAMIPPETWTSDETARGLLGLWGLLLLPALGGGIGYFGGQRRTRMAPLGRPSPLDRDPPPQHRDQHERK